MKTDKIETLLNISKIQNMFSLMNDKQLEVLSEVNFWYDSEIHFSVLINWILEEMKEIVEAIK